MLYLLSWVSPSHHIDQSKTFCIQFAVFCGLGLGTLAYSKRIYMVSILLILWPTTFVKAQVYFRSIPFFTSEIFIGALSHRTGLPVSTIRFYDDNGLIQSNRNGGGHRRFERAQIRRVSFVIAAQKFGYTLPQIKNLLNSCEMNVPQLPKIGSNFRESFGKVWMGKSRNCKNCLTHYQTASGAGVYLWKAAGSIIPKISWHRMDPDRGG